MHKESIVFGAIATTGAFVFGLWMWGVASSIQTDYNNRCIDVGGAPVDFRVHIKEVGQGFRCITDFKIVETKK